jgi:hypothetical protein
VNSAGDIITSAPAPGATTSRGGNGNNGNNDNTDDDENITTTDRVGSSITLSDATVGAVITTTDGQGRTLVTTITPSGGRVSELVLRTSTLPNGGRQTITSFEIVGANAAPTSSSAEAATATSSGRGDPSLQDSMAAPSARYTHAVAALVVCAIGVVAFL